MLRRAGCNASFHVPRSRVGLQVSAAPPQFGDLVRSGPRRHTVQLGLSGDRIGQEAAVIQRVN